MSVERSPAMIRAAYFMAKYGEPGNNGRPKPPAEMGVKSWAEAYRQLFPQLSGGRSFETFRASINQDRRHYLDYLGDLKSDSEDRREILGDFVHGTRPEQWAEIRKYLS
jgi:hypothetical protein